MGIILLPSPLLTIIVVLSNLYVPDVYFGNNPWSGAIKPPTKGSLNCPPCACPEKTTSNSYSL